MIFEHAFVRAETKIHASGGNKNIQMFYFLSKSSRAMWTPVCHRNGNMYTFEISTLLRKPSNVCSFVNTFNCENKITGARKNEKMPGYVFGINIGCVKENRGFYAYLSNYQKCNFHSSSSLFSYPNTGYGGFQEPDRRKANIYIAMILSLVAFIIWGNYKIYWTTYDEPVKKAEKL